MRTFDLTPLFRTSVGFDRLQRTLDSAARVDSANSYPPYDIESLDQNQYRITLAVAGFTSDDIEITTKENSLVIEAKGKTDGNAETTYLHQGIARRSFTHRFELADHVKVVDANMNNGLLVIELQREIPEALKPRKISIGADLPKAIENKNAA